MSDNEWWKSRSIWTLLRCVIASGWSAVTATWSMYAPWHERAERNRKHGYSIAPWWVWPLHLVIAVPAFAFEQAYGCHIAFERHWPMWPLECATWIHTRFDDLIKPYVVNYAYLPPDSGDPQEIGLHYRADLLTMDRETYEYVNRPRIFNRSPIS